MTDCLLRAISYIAVQRDTKVYVVSVARCSTVYSKAADAISKAAWEEFRELVPNSELDPRPVMGAFAVWFDKPWDDFDLGEKIFAEMVSKYDLDPMF